MYVWLDALTNYITGLGYPDDTELWRRYWPADIHLIGKDVVRFHAVYWPAFLMSAGIALPKQVYGHGFLLSRGEKMSKSVGNVVDPIALAERFGVDALRYFLLREVTFGQDGSYSAEAIVARANAELANSFGNLAQRVLTQIVRNCGGGLPEIRGQTMPTMRCSRWSAAPRARRCPRLSTLCVLVRDRKLDPGGVRLQRLHRRAGALDVAQDRSGADGGGARDAVICIAISRCRSPSSRPASTGCWMRWACRRPENFDGIISHWYSPLAESDFRSAQPTPLFPRLELAGGRGGRHEADR